MPTQLDPLSEVLFQSWARAHGIDNHDDPNNRFDHRGLYQQSNGKILPPKFLQDMTAQHNAATEPQEGAQGGPDPFAAQADMHGNMLKAQSDQAKLKAQAELEDKKHQNKLEIERMKLHFKAQQDQKQQAEEHNNQLQQAVMQRHFSVQDMHAKRQHDVEDQQVQRHHEMTTQAQDQNSQLQQALVAREKTGAL